MKEHRVPHFHVIDGNHRRRAQIARELMSRGLHAEIYEDIAEFCREDRGLGVMLASSADGSCLSDKIANGEIAVPVILYSEQPSTPDIVDAISSGAADFLEWPFTRGTLDRLMERLEGISGRKAAEIRKRSEALARVKKLSAREREVLTLMVQGGSNRSIGKDLGISPRTVEIHRANLMNKLTAQSSADAVRIGFYAGLDQAPNLETRVRAPAVAVSA